MGDEIPTAGETLCEPGVLPAHPVVPNQVRVRKDVRVQQAGRRVPREPLLIGEEGLERGERRLGVAVQVRRPHDSAARRLENLPRGCGAEAAQQGVAQRRAREVQPREERRVHGVEVQRVELLVAVISLARK